jgi:asparagine synthase (glutamine-hydrolysing)
MAGITGIVGGRISGENMPQLREMLQSMAQEPFHTSGTYSNKQLGLSVGWVAHGGSSPDVMPVWNKTCEVGVILFGEIYPGPTRSDCFGTGKAADQSCDANFLVEGYEKIGLEVLAKLNGWFSGMFIDVRQQRIVLFNDRYGIGRIYYHEGKDGLYFSSEAKSLLRVLPELRKLDYRSVGEFLSCGCALENRTLFSGVSLLPGGAAWTFMRGPGGSVRKESYFHPKQWETQDALGEAEYYAKLKETWKRILPQYLCGNERVGLSLTGGVDSRMIMAWADRPPGALPCYTFGGSRRDCADVTVARDVARICGQPHEILPVGREFLEQFPALAEQTIDISDGTMDVTGTIDLYVQRLARRIAPVRVTGTNGGEILRRLVAFKPMHFRQDVFDPELVHHMHSAARTYAQELQGHRLTFTAFKQAPWFMNSKFSVERSQITLRMPYFDNDLVALSYQAPAGLAENNEPALRLIADGNPALARIGTDRGIRMGAIPGWGRAAHLLQQFTFKAEYAYDYGMPQWLARLDHTLGPLRPERLFLGRHKFHHFRVFYRDELSRYVKEILLDPRTLGRSLYRKLVLEEIVRGHVGGYRNYTLEIHKLLTIELIQRKLIELN